MAAVPNTKSPTRAAVPKSLVARRGMNRAELKSLALRILSAARAAPKRLRQPTHRRNNLLSFKSINSRSLL
jgi:hypothetical protein